MELNFNIDPIDVFNFLRQIPFINISKDALIEEDLVDILTPEQIEKFKTSSLINAGVGRDKIEEICASIIEKEVMASSIDSLIASNPALMFMLASIPADSLQFISHAIRISLKLLYVYGLKDISELKEDENLTIFVFLGKLFNISAIELAFEKTVKALAASSKDNSHLNIGLSLEDLKGQINLTVVELMKLLPQNVLEKGVTQSIPLIGNVLAGGLNLKKLSELSIPFNESLYQRFFVEFDKLN